jgi:hypothetical protein
MNESKTYLAVLATIALVVIAVALAVIAATQVRQVQQKANSCTFLYDQAKPSTAQQKLIRECVKKDSNLKIQKFYGN